MQYFLQRKAIVAKTSPADLAPGRTDVVRIINFLKTKPVKSRTFASFWEEMGAVLYVICYFSIGKSGLARVYELREKLKVFFDK